MRFPKQVEDLSTELLTTALAEMQPGVRVRDFEIVETIACESGYASTADRVVLELDYADTAGYLLPARMMLKTMLVSPHAPTAMYAAEVQFYRHLRPGLAIEAPRAFAAMVDEPSGQFGLLLEDLGQRQAVFPNTTVAVSLDQVRSLIANLAKIHATFWESPRLSGDLAWLCTPARGGMSDFFRQVLPFIESHLEEAWRRELLDAQGWTAATLFQGMLAAQDTALEHGPRTLLHGDTHLGNTYLLPDGSAGLLDFQLTMQGCFSRDLTYYITTALDTATRREQETELIRYYLNALGELGVSDVPDFDSAWLLHRQAALWGLVIGWMVCPTKNYGRQITELNLQRLTAAVADLEALAAVAG